MDNMFELATRKKIRFRAANGLVGVEDLWDLSLPALDTIAKGLRKELRESEDSFIAETKTDATLELRFEVVKHIITVKIAERDAKREAQEAKEREKVLLAELENRQKGKVEKLSDEDLEKELAALRAKSRAA